MKLEWLAAVLRPRDILALRQAPDANYSSQPHVLLAAAVCGESLPPPLFDRDKPTETYDALESSAVELATKTFFAGSQRNSATELVELVLQGDLDIAATCALALVAVNALAELEENMLIERVLGSVLDRLAPKSPAVKLLRVCVLQQLKLRRQDWGNDDNRLSAEANRLLKSIKGAKFPSFPVNKISTRDSNSTLNHIVDALQNAIWSAMPTPYSARSEDDVVVDWEEFRLTDWPDEFLQIQQERADVYGSYIKIAFGRAFGDRSQYYGRSTPDLFYVNLRNELYGSNAVYGTRKELALLRLLEAKASTSTAGHAECLRYLRYGKGESELALALEQLRLGGPLASLSDDARRVVRRRLSPKFVRSEDLQVVRAAADLLTEPELQLALSAALALLDAGSPFNDPGRWSAPASRRDRTWAALVSIANAAGAVDVAAARLLSDIKTTSYDELLDRYYARALDDLEWAEMVDRDAWQQWLASAPEWDLTADVARRNLGLATAQPSSDTTKLTDALAVVTDLLNTREVSRSSFDASVTIVRTSMASIRDAARSGQYGMGGVEPADLAAVLVQFDAADLWPDLVSFLLDPVVPRTYKTDAFDRLAASTPDLPADALLQLNNGRDSLLLGRDASPIGAERITPYPAALRFYAANRLMADDDLVVRLYELTGSRAARAQEEAARTVSVLGNSRADIWLVGLALQLSYEDNPRVKGYAAKALALMIEDSPTDQGASLRRLVELLESDGLIAPLLAIRGLAAKRTATNSRLRQVIVDLANQHPSRQIRTAAKNLVESW